MIEFLLNDRTVTTGCPGGIRVLDWLRNEAGLTGTREGCREGDCGACTVVLGSLEDNGMRYRAVCSCLLPLSAVHRSHLVTIEGISAPGKLSPFQKAFVEECASQCGFCTPGMIMSLTGFLLGKRKLTLENAMESLDGNICRCTGYASVRRAVESVMAGIRGGSDRVAAMVEQGHVPEYFNEVPSILGAIGERSVTRGTMPVAGGTDVYVHPDAGASGEEPFFIQAPAGINIEGGMVLAGAGTTVEEIRESPVFRELFPDIDGFLARVASTQIRSLATIGGNIVNASPIGDLAVLFLALGATVHTGRRSLPLKEFYLGYKKTDLDEGEIIESISFPLPREGARLSALKVCKREYLDIASVNSAALLVLQGSSVRSASLSAGGVYPYPLFLEAASSFLQGRELTESTILETAGIAAGEIAPISDIRGSAEYKTLLLRSQVIAHLEQAGS